jgi:uncharacterized membrane protein
MSMTALAHLAGVFLVGAITLYGAGFYIYDLGYWGGAIGAWVFASLLTGISVKLFVIFKREYHVQKQREVQDDSTRETVKMIIPKKDEKE